MTELVDGAREEYLGRLGTQEMAEAAEQAIVEIERLEGEVAERRATMRSSAELLEERTAELLLLAEGGTVEARRAALQVAKLKDADWLARDAVHQGDVGALAQAEAERDREIRRYQLQNTLLRLRTAQLGFLGGEP